MVILFRLGTELDDMSLALLPYYQQIFSRVLDAQKVHKPFYRIYRRAIYKAYKRPE